MAAHLFSVPEWYSRVPTLESSAAIIISHVRHAFLFPFGIELFKILFKFSESFNELDGPIAKSNLEKLFMAKNKKKYQISSTTFKSCFVGNNSYYFEEIVSLIFHNKIITFLRLKKYSKGVAMMGEFCSHVGGSSLTKSVMSKYQKCLSLLFN